MVEKRYNTIGHVTHRKDGRAKVMGKETYSSDIILPNMLYARVIRSPYPHAKLLSFDTTEAEKMGAVCITPDDVPKIRYNERQVSIPEKTYRRGRNRCRGREDGNPG